MQIGEKEATWIGGILIGWLTTMFVNVWKVGRLREKYNQTEATVAFQGSEIASLRAHHNADMQSMKDFFATSSGGQKFITFPDHEAMCGKNSALTIQAIAALTEALKENTIMMEKMGDRIHVLDRDVAVLKERRQSGMRREGYHED